MKILAALALFVVIATGASAQLTTENGGKSDQTNIKIHKLDLLIKILPLALKKGQYNDLLLEIEKVRSTQKKELQREDDVLAKLDGKISDALDAALNKTTYPPRELQTEIANSSETTSEVRSVMMRELVDNMYAAVAKIFNPGQIKVMAGSFADQYIDPSAKKGDLKDDVKAKFFIQYVLLDPTAYDLLISLQKNAPAESDK